MELGSTSEVMSDSRENLNPKPAANIMVADTVFSNLHLDLVSQV